MSMTKENIFKRAIKASLIIWLMLSCVCALSNICVSLSSNYKASGAIVRDDTLTPSLTMAFKDEHFNDYQLYQSKNYTELVNQIQNMSNGPCSVVLGLILSQECMIAGPALQKNKTVGISTCLINGITQFFPYVYSALPTLQDFSIATATKTNRTKEMGAIYAFYQPTDVYSSTAYKVFKKHIKKPVAGIPVELNGHFSLNDIHLPSNKKITFIFFTYPLPSARILIQLDSQHFVNRSTDIIGNASWIFQLSSIRPVTPILKKSNSVITQSILDQKSILSSSFYKRFKEEQHYAPEAREVITYDIARFSTECYKKTIANGQFNNKDFLSCLRTTHYQGIAGPMTFAADSPFSTRKIHFINLINWL